MRAFREIKDSSLKVVSLIGEIAAASQEQSQGIEQVNKAVAQMNSVTQQNAAGAEELASVMAMFRTDENGKLGNVQTKKTRPALLSHPAAPISRAPSKRAGHRNEKSISISGQPAAANRDQSGNSGILF